MVVDLVLTSPYLRARQTAEVIARGLQPCPPVVTLRALAPGGSSMAVIRVLAKRYRADRVALVGHEPGMSELAEALAKLGSVDFRKGAVCRIDFDDRSTPPNGRLRWFATTRILRRLSD